MKSRQGTSGSTGPSTNGGRGLTTTTSRSITGRNDGRSRTGRRPTTTATSLTGYQDIVCSVSESRGISPNVGLAFVNLSTSEAVLCQICDSQTYVRTIHKLKVFSPTEILYPSTAAESKFFSIIAENVRRDDREVMMTEIDRRYWSESTGHDYVRQLAFPEDLEALNVSLSGNYFAACCFGAVMKYVQLALETTFCYQSLRIKFEPSEGSMMIDLSTTASLELIQNLQNPKSKDCLFGLLNETQTPMGARILRSNIMQPSTDRRMLEERYRALHELTTKEETFHNVRTALKQFVDSDRVLASMVITPTKIDFWHAEQCINYVVMLKTFVDSIEPIWQALAGATSGQLAQIRDLCNPENYKTIQNLIRSTLNDDISYSKQPLELRNQRTYAIKAGVNGFLDVARQTYKEASEDALSLVANLNGEYDLALDLKFETPRQYYIRIPISELDDRDLPDIFINVFRKRAYVECQTLDLMKLNQKITDAHNEVINMSDHSIQDLMTDVRSEIHPLFKISEGIAMLDMLSAFAQLVTTHDYVQPEFTDTLAIKAGRHPVHEKVHDDKFIPNDVYATEQNRFQIITGCNMSGKSTYIRSIALMTIMAQVGCFVPAQYASFPIMHQMFARTSSDDSMEANISTFASEMREIAFILRNIEPRSLIIVDELGRGTSTTDGLAIALAVAEALIDSKALVWFVTHFRELSCILQHRIGVVNLHLTVDVSHPSSRIKMLYKISDGWEEEKLYGLTMARVAGLPEDVITVGTRVSQSLNEQLQQRKKNRKIIAVARRRKLVLSLKEQLLQARNGNMEPEDLRRWLKRLQDEFVVRMAAIDAEALEEVQTEGAEENASTLPEGDTNSGDDEIDEAHEVEEVVGAKNLSRGTKRPASTFSVESNTSTEDPIAFYKGDLDAIRKVKLEHDSNNDGGESVFTSLAEKSP